MMQATEVTQEIKNGSEGNINSAQPGSESYSHEFHVTVVDRMHVIQIRISHARQAH